MLLDDPEHFVQTSVGLAIRELNRAAPERCTDFLKHNAGRLSSTTRRLARNNRGKQLLIGDDGDVQHE